MADEDLKAELERLRKENAALKKSASAESRIRVSPKGGVFGLRNGQVSRDLI